MPGSEIKSARGAIAPPQPRVMSQAPGNPVSDHTRRRRRTDAGAPVRPERQRTDSNRVENGTRGRGGTPAYTESFRLHTRRGTVQPNIGRLAHTKACKILDQPARHGKGIGAPGHVPAQGRR